MWADESLETQRVTVRQAQQLLDAQEWAAVEVPKALARMGALRAALLGPVEGLEQLDESESAK